MSKVMAVVLNYNTSDDTKKCVDYLQKQQNTDLKICIVDNGSTDGTTSELEKYADQNQILFIANSENKGFSAGNNVGLKKAAELGCDYAWIINPDVEIRDADYASKAIAKMDEDKKIAVLGTDVIDNNGQHQNPMGEPRFLEEVIWPLLWIRNKINQRFNGVRRYKKSRYCKKVSGCCFFVDMQFIKSIDYLDENVFLYSEEPILSVRVKRMGLKEYYYSEISAYHIHIPSEKGNKNDSLKTFYKSRRYFIDTYNRYGRIGKHFAIASLKLQEKIKVKE